VNLESVYIRISKADNIRHAYLGMEGTILLFGQRQGATDSELQIPVELVTISEGRRFKGARLIAGLLSLAMATVFGSLFYGLATSVVPAENEAVRAILTTLSTGVLLLGVVAFLVLLVMFFFRVETVRLGIEPSGTVIEFYKHRQQAGEIDEFVEELRRRQGLVSDSLAAAAKRPVGFTQEHSVIPKLAAFLWIASMPAIITEKPALFVLPLGVLVWFAYGQVQYRRQPREYRQAVRRYLRGDLDGAIDALQSLRNRLADYVPAYFFLAEVFTRTGRFEEALDMASYLSRDYPDLAQQMQSDIWLFKRIHQRRQGEAL
jgi:tetratricopeptide (TPR) repeat protein